MVILGLRMAKEISEKQLTPWLGQVLPESLHQTDHLMMAKPALTGILFSENLLITHRDRNTWVIKSALHLRYKRLKLRQHGGN